MTVEARENDVVAPRRGRWRHFLAATLVVVAVVGLLTLAWVWRHPKAFPDAGGWGSGYTAAQPGSPVYFGLTYAEDSDHATVTIHGSHARVAGERNDVDTQLLVCTADPAHAGAVGVATDIDAMCSTVVPADGEVMRLDVDGRQQLVLAVTLSEPGSVRIDGVEVTYSYGWQRGTQTVGGTLTAQTR